MKTMKSKIVFLCLVVMWCVPSIGYAQSLQEAIDEALIVPLAKLEAQVRTLDWPEYEEGMKAAFDEYMAVPLENEYAKQAAWEKYKAATAKKDEMFAAQDKARAAIATAKAKARQGKQRARHCRATLKSVDDHVEIIEIVKCVQTMEAIADRCRAKIEQYRLDGLKLRAEIDAEIARVNSSLGKSGLKEFEEAAIQLNKELKEIRANTELFDIEINSLKDRVTQCVTANITGYSALVHYIVTPETKDQYAGLIEKCRQEETNTLGVLGYEFIWPCFKGYLDMIDEPLEPEPTEISPEPVEDSGTLPKVKA